MAPHRSDYKTRKEYRWAKKVESRGALTRPIENAKPLKGSTCIGIIAFVVLVGISAAALPGHPGAAAVLVIVVPAIAAVAFSKTPLVQRWGSAWDSASRRKMIKQVEEGDRSIGGRYAANALAKEGIKVPMRAPAKPAPQPSVPNQSAGLATEIDRLTALHKAGALTEEEFAKAKAKLLG
jgi:hypothetical protein